MGCSHFRGLSTTCYISLRFICAYIDDLLRASLSLEEHIKHVRLIFERFEKFGVVINLVKCEFGKSGVIFFGHYKVSKKNSTRISLSFSKVEAIANFPVPDTMRKLRQFLVMINYYRKFLPKCAQVIKPLTDMLMDVKNCDIVLSVPAIGAFKEIQNILS